MIQSITTKGEFTKWNLNMKSIESLTLSELMGQDLRVKLKRHEKFGFDLQIEDENFNELLNENIHPYSAESFADFCRQFLESYDKNN